LRRSLKMQEQSSLWDSRLKWMMYLSIVLFVIETVFHRLQPITDWAASLALAGFIYMLYSQNIFKAARSIVIAIAPYTIICLFVLGIKDIAPETYKYWQDILENIKTFTVLWGIGVWLVTMR